MRRFLVSVCVVTAASLFYVYTEVEAVRIGYQIRKQEECRVQLVDRARALKYNIARLEAPHNLERRLQAQRITLGSPKAWETLVLSGAAGAKPPKPPVFEPRPFIAKFFVGTAQAEAKETRSR